MDAFTLIMALSLGAAGWFLCRDFVRFISSVYTIKGRVVSVQQVFIPKPPLPEALPKYIPFVEDGFYPVIAYDFNGESVRFTAIGRSISGQFHIGDSVYLKFFKTRRKQNRMTKTSFLLMALIALVCIGLLAGAFYTRVGLTMTQISQASFVLAVCFFILVLYIREQDENNVSLPARGSLGRYKLALSVPSAFHNWVSNIEDRRQASKIRAARVLGGIFMFMAFAILIFTFRL